MKIDESYLARRRFLCCMLGGGVAAMAAGIGLPLMEYAGDFHSAPPPDFLVLEKADYELPPGKAKMILYGHIPVLLLQPAETRQPLEGFRRHLHPSQLHRELPGRREPHPLRLPRRDLRHRGPRRLRSAAAPVAAVVHQS